MTIFFAYVSEIANDSIWRFVLTFADSATADEWWRAVSGANNTLLTGIQRINPQLYTHKASVFNIYNFFVDSRIKDIADKFRGRLFMTLQNDRGGKGIDIIPNQNVTELISGNWFYIRSKADPTMYWFYDTEKNCQNCNKITVSNTARTMFRIVAADLPDKTVMIRSDRVTLTIWPQVCVNINEGGSLIGGSYHSSFDFSSFEAGRFINTNFGLLFEQVDSSAPRKPGWELVI